MTLPEIEKKATTYGETRNELLGAVGRLEKIQLALTLKHMPEIRRLVQKAAKQEAELREAIGDNRDQFVKPKSIIAAGIRFGLKKGSGGYEIEDEDAVIERIKKLIPEDEQDALLKTEVSLKKAGLDDLEGSMLKKLGVVVQGDEDVVFIKPVDSKLSSAVKAMLKAARDTIEKE
jgi:hypothetical protein